MKHALQTRHCVSTEHTNPPSSQCYMKTKNPNLPLRFLFYVSNVYSSLTRNANLYGTKTVEIPTPEFMNLEDAVEKAIQECISEGILKEFLEKNRAEAKEMSIFEYDQEKHLRQERESAWEDGCKAGREEGLTAGRQIIAANLLREGLSKTQVSKLCEIPLSELPDINSNDDCNTSDSNCNEK